MDREEGGTCFPERSEGEPSFGRVVPIGVRVDGCLDPQNLERGEAMGGGFEGFGVVPFSRLEWRGGFGVVDLVGCAALDSGGNSSSSSIGSFCMIVVCRWLMRV